jgi:hypothetical protein
VENLPPVSLTLVSMTPAVLVTEYAASVIDTFGKFATGVVNTGSKFSAGVVDTCVVDTGGEP